MTPLETAILHNLSPRDSCATWEIANDLHVLPRSKELVPGGASDDEINRALASLEREGRVKRVYDGWQRVPERAKGETQPSLF